MSGSTLEAFVRSHGLRGGDYPALSDLVLSLADAAVRLRSTIAQGAGAAMAAGHGSRNADGDVQRSLDITADEIFLAAARSAGVAHYCSEEMDSAVDLNGTSRLALAIDPLDGSSNIETNLSVGTIFAILPAAAEGPEASFRQMGEAQLAAGFFIFGPQLALALSLGAGTRIFLHSQRLGTFLEANRGASIPERTQEFAINVSNYRHWDERVRLYVDDCLKGSEGPRQKDFNMRWTASLVAEAFRILARGGVFLYPSDGRRGYSQGRLRLVYEANPIAFLIEQAGGAATDAIGRILERRPESLHQRVPLVFGAKREVARIARYHTEPSLIAERAPLFGNRGLFRA